MPTRIQIIVDDKEAARRIQRFSKKAGADVKQLEKKSVASAQKMSMAFRGVANMLGPLGIGIGMASAVIGIKKLIKVGSDLEESMDLVSVVFGKAAGSIEKFAETSATAMGLSKQKTLEATGGFGALLVAMKVDQLQAANMSKTIVQLGVDLSSLYNKPIQEALIALRAAMVGEYEPMRRLGATLSVARVEQRALADGIKFTKGAMDAQTKVLTTMKLLMEDTAVAQGNFQLTSDGLANSSRILSAQWSDLLADFSKFITPIAVQVVSGLRDIGFQANDLYKVLRGDQFISQTKGLVRSTETYEQAWNRITEVAKIYNKVEKEVIYYRKLGAMGYDEIREAIDRINPQLKQYGVQLDYEWKQLLLGGKAAKQWAADQQPYLDALKKRWDAMEALGLQKPVVPAVLPAEEAAAQVNKYGNIVVAGQKKMNDIQWAQYKAHYESLRILREEYQEKLKRGLAARQTWEENTAAAIAEYKKQKVREAEAEVDRAGRKARGPSYEFARMANNLAYAAIQGQSLGDAIKDIGKQLATKAFSMLLMSLLPGGQAFSLGGLLGFQHGGTVPGPVGQPQMAVVHGGERITPANQITNNNNINIYPQHGDENWFRNDFVPMFNKLKDEDRVYIS